MSDIEHLLFAYGQAGYFEPQKTIMRIPDAKKSV